MQPTPRRKARQTSTGKRGTPVPRVLDARPDTLDFRDRMYVPTLVEVPPEHPLARYQAARVPILDQGRDGACTGFGLAAVVHYLLRTRAVEPDAQAVSPQMLYAMARRYDEWAGERYEGSSCRGAMKGWHKHGVCASELWDKTADATLSEERINDAARRPLGAYFRVNHRDLVAMHAALAEVGTLFVSASVHAGWDAVAADGRIPWRDGSTGGHAFALVGYDRKGFWVHNSWGPGWGRGGFGHVAYEDWLANGTDAWVARLAVPIELPNRVSTSARVYGGTLQAKAYVYNEIRPHVISTGHDGLLDPHGNVGTTAALVEEIVHRDIPRITAGWERVRIVLYAHGGLVDEASALARVAEYRKAMLAAQCYPLAFVWHSDAWSTLADVLADAAGRRRSEGALDASKDFMLDRLDDALEPLARVLGGKRLWDEMKENAVGATVNAGGGARLVLDALARARYPFELHVVGHSAGSIFLTPLVQLWTASGAIGEGPLAGQRGYGRAIESATLWAPAITTA
ncbi:MAG: C1 family peptidase, partial [Burkholderiales bacterium]|nr:C1 family peptidase [Burkholderiales bacterium]